LFIVLLLQEHGTFTKKRIFTQLNEKDMHLVRSKFVLAVLLSAFLNSGFAQIPVPYLNSFDGIYDTAGWTHYSASGNDVWELGTPSSVNLSSSYSAPNSWCSNLSGNYSAGSDIYLESPLFDFSDTNVVYVLSFYHKFLLASGTGASVEYSTNNGVSWELLMGPTSENKNWYSSSAGFTGSNYSNFIVSSHSLNFLRGEPMVKFRFRLLSGPSVNEGWLIDNFAITQLFHNIQANQGDTIDDVSPNFSSITVVCDIGLINQFSAPVQNTTYYYLSEDSVFNSGDTLLGSKSGSLTSATTSWSMTLTTMMLLILLQNAMMKITLVLLF